MVSWGAGAVPAGSTGRRGETVPRETLDKAPLTPGEGFQVDTIAMEILP